MWIVQVIILFISVKIGEYINSGKTEVYDWCSGVAQGERYENIIIKGKGEPKLSDEWVARYHTQFRYEYDPWYKDWIEKHIVTYKLDEHHVPVKIESEKEIEYWTKKYTLPYEEFDKWMQEKWKDKYVRDETYPPVGKVVPIDSVEDWSCIPHSIPSLWDIENSSYASEYLYK